VVRAVGLGDPRHVRTRWMSSVMGRARVTSRPNIVNFRLSKERRNGGSGSPGAA